MFYKISEYEYYNLFDKYKSFKDYQKIVELAALRKKNKWKMGGFLDAPNREKVTETGNN